MGLFNFFSDGEFSQIQMKYISIIQYLGSLLLKYPSTPGYLTPPPAILHSAKTMCRLTRLSVISCSSKSQPRRQWGYGMVGGASLPSTCISWGEVICNAGFISEKEKGTF